MRSSILVLALLAAALPAARAACPADPGAPAETSLSVLFEGEPVARLGASELDRMPSASLGANTGVAYAGVLLRDLVAAAPAYERQGRAQRRLVVEAVATDGYKAVFSWGELMNSSAAAQVLVIRSQNGVPLDAAAGPLALRALADARPGPRHVRNLCALVVHPL